MYKPICAIDLAEGRPSVLIPVFSYKDFNEPFVQTVDGQFKIYSFYPFYNVEHYPTISLADCNIFVRTGDECIFVIRDFANNIRCFTNRVSLSLFYRENMNEIRSFPLLNLQIVRIIEEKRSIIYDAVIEASRTYFQEEEDQSMWANLEVLATQNRDQIMSSISSPKRIDKNYKTIIEDYNDVDVELTLRLLSNHSLYDSPEWENAWFFVYNHFLSHHFRLVELAVNWIYYNFASGYTRDVAINVFCAILPTIKDDPDSDFADFLYENAQALTFFSETFNVPFTSKTIIFGMLKQSLSHTAYASLLIKTIASAVFDLREAVFFSSELRSVLFEVETIDEVVGFNTDRLLRQQKSITRRVEVQILELLSESEKSIISEKVVKRLEVFEFDETISANIRAFVELNSGAANSDKEDQRFGKRKSRKNLRPTHRA